MNRATADPIFNDEHQLVDFISDDRLAASADGKTFTQRRWSTPLRGYTTIGSRTLATTGEGVWHAPEPEGEFTYVEFNVDDITYNVTSESGSPASGEVSASPPNQH